MLKIKSSNWKSGIAISCLFLLLGCSSNAADNSDVVNASETSGTSDPLSSDQTDLSNPVFARAECGTSELAGFTASSDVDAAVNLLVGRVAQGSVTPKIESMSANYWDVSVSDGTYHLVVDSKFFNGVAASGMKVQLLNQLGSVQETLIDKTIAAQLHRYRTYAFLTVPSDQVIRLKVTSLYQKADYQIALYRNGEFVPSPYLIDCPDVLSMSPGTTEAFSINRLPENSWIATEKWALIDLDAGTYDIVVDASRFAAERGVNIHYSVAVVGGFGQLGLQSSIGSHELDIANRKNYVLTVDRSGPFYMRFTNNRLGADLNMEVSVNKK